MYLIAGTSKSWKTTQKRYPESEEKVGKLEEEEEKQGKGRVQINGVIGACEYRQLRRREE